MKRFLILGLLIVAFIVLYVNVNAEVDEIVIPEAAISVRVIANSNQIHDQNMKMKVKKYIETSISPTLLNVRDVNEARGVIKNSLSDLDSGIKELFSDNLYDKDFVIHFGDNYFPEKDYRGVHYEAGAYESLVVTIGEGEGDNWWCVLFPPLCLLEADENTTGDVEYQFFVAKMIHQFFK
ncbi:MAG: stage II sporulation protein R [Bacilli bacterium]|nr:stage II sporulation protein R [Bacilli bacterium]